MATNTVQPLVLQRIVFARVMSSYRQLQAVETLLEQYGGQPNQWDQLAYSIDSHIKDLRNAGTDLQRIDELETRLDNLRKQHEHARKAISTPEQQDAYRGLLDDWQDNNFRFINALDEWASQSTAAERDQFAKVREEYPLVVQRHYTEVFGDEEAQKRRKKG